MNLNLLPIILDDSTTLKSIFFLKFEYLCQMFYTDQPGSCLFSGSQDLGFLFSAQLPQTCLSFAGGSPLISWMNAQGLYLEKQLFIGSSGPVFLVYKYILVLPTYYS